MIEVEAGITMIVLMVVVMEWMDIPVFSFVKPLQSDKVVDDQFTHGVRSLDIKLSQKYT
jgi:hypothetical protein